MSLNPASLSFTAQTVGTSSTAQTIALTNTGGATLSLTSIVAGGDFALTNNCGAGLVAGGSCSLSITFAPTSVGTRTDSITITSNATGSPHSASLSGTGKVAVNYTLGVTKSGTGTGTVASSPPGISCGETCSAGFSSDTSVVLTATPAAGSAFTGWSGACSGLGTCTVAMNQSQNVTATFISGPVSSASDITGMSELAIHVYRALYGQAPSNALLLTYSQQIGSSNGFAWANQMVASFSGVSDYDFSTLIMTNLGLLGLPALHDPLMWYLGAAGIANRGTVVIQVGEIVSNLQGDAVWGSAAAAFNAQCVIDFNTLLFGP